MGTVHNAGFFIAIPLTGLISDKYGRRPALVFASVANGIFGVIRALSVNYDMFVVFEFLEPAFGGGVYTACFVLGKYLIHNYLLPTYLRCVVYLKYTIQIYQQYFFMN